MIYHYTFFIFKNRQKKTIIIITVLINKKESFMISNLVNIHKHNNFQIFHYAQRRSHCNYNLSILIIMQYNKYIYIYIKGIKAYFYIIIQYFFSISLFLILLFQNKSILINLTRST